MQPQRFSSVGSTPSALTTQVQTDFIIRLEKSKRISLSAQTEGLYYTTHYSTKVDDQANSADLKILGTWLSGAYFATWLGEGWLWERACQQ